MLMAEAWESIHEIHLEPAYEAFICPLTGKVMRDPVTLENGHTFEREAIEKWFRECQEEGRKIICPLTRKQLHSVDLNPSIALRNTIEEWTKRNDAIMIEISRRSLSSSTPEPDVLQTFDYIQTLCQKKKAHKQAIRSAGLIPMIVDMLKNASSRVRLKSLETLRNIAEGDDDNKEEISGGDTIRTIVKFLSQDHSETRLEAVLLLYELSKSEKLSEKIGEVRGAILLLVSMSSSKSESVQAVDTAIKTLGNLESCEKNVLQMAENGWLAPLLRLLLQGSPETKVAMTEYLGELALSNDVKLQVAETAGRALVEFLKTGPKPAREAALRALAQISTADASAAALLRSGLLPPLMSTLLTVGPTRLKELSAAVLADLVSAPDGAAAAAAIPLSPLGLTLTSEPTVHSLLHVVSNAGPTIESRLLHALAALSSSPATAAPIAAAVLSSGAAPSLALLPLAPNPDLRLPAVKLLRRLAPFLAPHLAAALLSAPAQLLALARAATATPPTEEQAETAALLADLAHANHTLAHRLFPAAADLLAATRAPRPSRFSAAHAASLSRLLSSLTFLLDDPSVVSFSKANDLCALFVDMLDKPPEQAAAAATALEQLSRQSRRLAAPPPRSKTLFCGLFQKHQADTCRVHGGVCSARENFCLVRAGAVGKLVGCLETAEVAAAAMAALCTLLEDGQDLAAAVEALEEVDGVERVLDVLAEGGREEGLRRRAVWAGERLLRDGEIAARAGSRRSLGVALVEAFQIGDTTTKQLAEKALNHINRLPKFSGIYSKKS
ncbi:U-box domain-containing protein 44-like [Wolffia australiana]